MNLTPEETWSADFHNQPGPEKNQAQESRDQPKTSVQPKQVSPPPPTSFGSEQWSAPLKNPNSPTQFQATLIIILLCVGIGLFAWNSFRTTKWDYKIESIPDINFDAEINRMGQDGWELVFARRASSGGSDISEKAVFSYEMIFKRPAR